MFHSERITVPKWVALKARERIIIFGVSHLGLWFKTTKLEITNSVLRVRGPSALNRCSRCLPNPQERGLTYPEDVLSHNLT